MFDVPDWPGHLDQAGLEPRGGVHLQAVRQIRRADRDLKRYRAISVRVYARGLLHDKRESETSASNSGFSAIQLSTMRLSDFRLSSPRVSPQVNSTRYWN